MNVDRFHEAVGRKYGDGVEETFSIEYGYRFIHFKPVRQKTKK